MVEVGGIKKWFGIQMVGRFYAILDLKIWKLGILKTGQISRGKEISWKEPGKFMTILYNFHLVLKHPGRPG